MNVNRNNENTSNPIIAYIKYELVLKILSGSLLSRIHWIFICMSLTPLLTLHVAHTFPNKVPHVPRSHVFLKQISEIPYIRRNYAVVSLPTWNHLYSIRGLPGVPPLFLLFLTRIQELCLILHFPPNGTTRLRSSVVR